MNRSLSCLIPALLLAACSTTPAEYPSLAKRPIERVSGSFEPPPPPPPPAPVDPAVVRSLDSLLEQVRATDTRFRAAEPGVRRQVLAASGAAMASEAWSVATVALSGLQTTRSEAMIALADIDAIYAASRITGEPASEAKATRDAAAAIVGEQDRIITDLAAQLER
jgi:hypothetical protein